LYGAADDSVRIWNQLRDAIQTGQPIFDKVMGISPFEHLGKNKAFAETFSRAMTELFRERSFRLRRLLHEVGPALR
jgi:hypothetical protein